MAMRVMMGRADNRKAAEQFYDLALAMEIQGERWRANSYLRAAKSIESLGEHLRSLSERKELRNIEGVGESIEAKLDEYLSTGKIEALESVRDVLPEDLALFRDAPTLGTRRVADLELLLGVRSVDELLRAIREEKLSELPDFGEEVERETMEWLNWKREEAAEVPTPYAIRSAHRIIDFLKLNDNMIRIELAGPARRRVPNVANITLLFTSDAPDLVVSKFGLCPEVLELTMVERDQAVGKTTSGAGCMIRGVREESFAVEMIRNTGADVFVKELSSIAKAKGLRLSTSGMGKGKHPHTEADVFADLDMDYVPPEMREGRRPKDGPVLMANDLLGDLHIRASSLDGALRVSEMARVAKGLGHSYVCFCDRIGGRRMDLDTFDRRNALIDEVEGLVGIGILKGAEVDITADGRLDAPPDLLDGLDLVIGSVNTKLTMPGDEMQSRIIRAMDDPNMDVLGHPTNRVIGLREGSSIDLVSIAERAAERKVALEINAYPDRLDLGDDDAYKVYDSGALYSLGTDASFPNELEWWEWGVTMARKALLPKGRMLNSLPVDRLRNRAWRK